MSSPPWRLVTPDANTGGKGAQFRRNGCSICAVEVLNLARNTQKAAGTGETCFRRVVVMGK